MRRKTKDGWTEVVDGAGQVVLTTDCEQLARDVDRRSRDLIGLRLPADLAAAIAEQARRQGVTRQSVCVALIRAGLDGGKSIEAAPLPRGLAAASDATATKVRKKRWKKGAKRG